MPHFARGYEIPTEAETEMDWPIHIVWRNSSHFARTVLILLVGIRDPRRQRWILSTAMTGICDTVCSKTGNTGKVYLYKLHKDNIKSFIISHACQGRWLADRAIDNRDVVSIYLVTLLRPAGKIMNFLIINKRGGQDTARLDRPVRPKCN